MACKDMLGNLSDYVGGELPQELCAEIERHVAECGNCRIVVDTLRRTVTLYREHGHQDLPADARSRLFAVLHLQMNDQQTAQ